MFRLRKSSELGTDRSRVSAAGPETAGFRFHFRLAGFYRCRNRVFCRNIFYVPELAGNFHFLSYATLENLLLS